jgi:hypothetical protein
MSKKIIRMALVAAFSVLGNVSVQAAPLACEVREKHQCAPQSPCRPIPSTVRLELDPATGAYSRCDAKGCDRHRSIVSRSGVWVNFAIPGSATFARVGDDGSVVEVAALNSTVLVGYGRCRQSRRARRF